MTSTTISRRILGCLLLALLSQYADARKSRYMETILMALNRLETMLIKQAEQNAVNCLVPAEKLFSLFSELQTSSNESNETNSIGPNFVIRRTMDLPDIFPTSRKPKNRKKNRSRNENENANVNENINTNVNNYNRHYRRSFDDNEPHFSKGHNQNMNSNFNYNTNRNRHREEPYDFSDEYDEV